MRLWPGTPYPLGATWDGSGTNFALFTEVAERVELCLFDGDHAGTETRVELTENDGFVWHAYLPDIGPGQRYAYRVHGPYAPSEGHRCNPAKLLLDPYGKAVDGQVRWDEAVFGYRFDDNDAPSPVDSAPYMPRSVVINPFFDWGNDRQPRIPYHETVIYEAHVRGLTVAHEGIPAERRGTYAGLAHPAVISHLTSLGVTSVELMPVHQFVPERELIERGLTNYWGYNTVAFLAPHNGYSASRVPGGQVPEFKSMVKALHEAGIEVLLDVVYNHTAEGNEFGPTLSYRGIDNAAYYQLRGEDRSSYLDYTGCGNSLNVRSPHALQLIMDSLRYWVIDMHVDGFRFDLAAALARELHDVNRLAAFFDLVQQDPVVSQVKLIAEPWDVGEGGYQVGNFPPLWSEWNGRYRDAVRDFWRSQPGVLPEFASRLAGSSDLYETSGRRPFASVNFVTCHDGFTLADLVSYNGKHNEANGENGTDGSDDNRSWNCGQEGPSSDPGVQALRAQQQRNFLATLFVSQGVPMLLSGDEFGRTQAGNNNAYCQDNPLSWVDWQKASRDGELLRFTRALAALRREHPVFRRRRFFRGHIPGSSQPGDIVWLHPSGREISDGDWQAPDAYAMTVFLNGDAITEPDPQGEPVRDDSFLVLLSAHHEPVPFTLPGRAYGDRWVLVLDTAQPATADPGGDPARAGNGRQGDRPRELKPGEEVTLTGHSLLVLRRLVPAGPERYHGGTRSVDS